MESGEMAMSIYGELESCTRIDDYSGAVNDRYWARRIGVISGSLGRVVERVNLKMYRNDVWFFTGKIWEKVPDLAVLYDAVKQHLRRHGVLEEDLFTRFRFILGEFYARLRLKPGLNPRYNIQAYLNGVLDLATGDFFPFGPQHDVIYLHGYSYDKGADCPVWRSFLRQVLPEEASRAILQMYLGLCTMDRGSMKDKVENCLMLYGTGANGKSVIFETIQGIFGKENVSGAGLGMMLREGDERLRTMAMLDGKVINVCPEIQARSFAGAEDTFKSLCSGEPQLGRRIRENIYTVYNVPRLIFNMNNVPLSEDGSVGFFRRFLYLVFEVVIPEEEQNKHLADDLKREYSGILNWIRRGAKHLELNRYVFPSSDNATRMMLKNMAERNITLSWFRARRIRTEKATSNEISCWMRSRDLYDDMCAYAEVNGFAPCDIKEFGRRMRELGFTPARGNKKRVSDGNLYRVYGFDLSQVGLDVPVIVDDTFVDTADGTVDPPYDPNDL